MIRRAWSLKLLVGTLAGVLLVVAAVNLWAWHHYRQANQLVARQHFAEAYPHYAQALKIWRWSADTQLLAGRTARRAGLYPEAEMHLAECERLQGGSSVPLALEYLLLRAQTGDILEVEETLWKYVDKNKPETPLILEALARGYVRMLRLGTAMRCLQMLLERQPDHIEALLKRGWIMQGREEQMEAVKDFRRALELDPRRDDARLSLAQTLLSNRPEEARSLFEEVLSRQPESQEALLGLAEAHRAVGEPEKARAILETILAKDPNNSIALTEMGSLALPSGNSKEAEELFRRAVAANPGNLKAHYQLYLVLAQQPGREKEASAQREIHKRVEQDQQRLAHMASTDMTRHPDDPDLHYEMGMLYLRNGKPEIGIRWLYSALKLDPTHQPSHQALYDYYKQKGDLEKAEQHQLQLHPTSAKQVSTRS
jgi:tetratricopeptide (TPR) repeat protein